MRLRAGHPGFSEAFAQAAGLARGRSNTQLARAAIGYAGRYYEAGVVDTTLIELLREALEEVGQEEHDLRARLLARLAEILHFAGDEEASLSLAREAVQIAHDLADDHVLADALAGYHVSMLHVRHLEERLVVSDELIRISRQIGDRERTLQGLHARIFDLIQAGEVADAKRALEELSELAQEVRQPLFAHFAVAWSATLAQMEGRLDEAERLAAESADMRRRLETADADSVFAAQLFLIRLGQGRVGELVPAVEQFVEAFPALAAWRAALPLGYLAVGREADSLRELERAVAAARSAAAGLLLARDHCPAGGGEREAPGPRERRRPLRRARAVLQAAWSRWATPVRSDRLRACSACWPPPGATTMRRSATWRMR